jgi:hypothetical protein
MVGVLKKTMRDLDSGIQKRKTAVKLALTNIRLLLVTSALVLSLPALGLCYDFEVPPVLSAANTVTDQPVETDIYRIEEPVPTDGFMALYSITSPHGAFTASGPGMLKTRLNEIRALAALQAMKEDERFVDAAEDTAKDTASNLRRLVEKPKETLEGVPEGVGRFFKRTGRTIKTGVQKLGDVREGRLPGVDDAETSTLPGGTATAVAPDTSLTESVLQASGDAAVNILGFDKQRRRLAKELAVDPYTTNAILAAKLDEVTWAAFAGGLGVNVLTSLIPGGLILSTSSRLSDWVWDTAPGDLRVEIEGALLNMGVGQSEVDQFLRHSFYTMSMQSVLTASLGELDGVAGRTELMPLVLSVGSEGQARFLVQTVDMLHKYHTRVAPLDALYIQGTVIGVNADEQPVVMAPIDYMSWTPALEHFASNLESVLDAAPVLYSTGVLSPLTSVVLSERGWTLENSSSLGVLAYPVQ